MIGRIAVICSATGLAACSETHAEQMQRMHTQVAMPNCPEAKVLSVKFDNYGQDYTERLELSAPGECVRKWKQALENSREYYCSAAGCTRYDERRRYDEEWATVRFNGIPAGSVKVELTKI